MVNNNEYLAFLRSPKKIESVDNITLIAHLVFNSIMWIILILIK